MFVPECVRCGIWWEAEELEEGEGDLLMGWSSLLSAMAVALQLRGCSYGGDWLRVGRLK